MKPRLMLRKLQFAKKTLALDIGSSGAKVLQLVSGSEGPVVTAAGYAALPGCLAAGFSENNLDIVQSAERAFAAAGVKPAGVISCLSKQNLAVRELKLPRMTAKELRAVLELNLEDYLPIKRQGAVVDFDVVAVQEDELEVLVFAAERRPIQRYVESLRQVGIRVTVLDILPYALLRAAAFCVPNLKTEASVLLLVDIGAETTKIGLFADGRLRLFRVVAIGSSRFTRLLMQTNGPSYSQAEETTRVHGLAGHISDPLLELRNSLFDEIWRSLRYILTQNRRLLLTRVFLSGGGSAMPGLIPQLERYLTIQIENFGQAPEFQLERINVWDSVNIAPQVELPPDRESGCFAVALGLALGGISSGQTD